MLFALVRTRYRLQYVQLYHPGNIFSLHLVKERFSTFQRSTNVRNFVEIFENNSVIQKGSIRFLTTLKRALRGHTSDTIERRSFIYRELDWSRTGNIFPRVADLNRDFARCKLETGVPGFQEHPSGLVKPADASVDRHSLVKE